MVGKTSNSERERRQAGRWGRRLLRLLFLFSLSVSLMDDSLSLSPPSVGSDALSLFVDEGIREATEPLHDLDADH